MSIIKIFLTDFARQAVYNENKQHLCVGQAKLYQHTHCLLTICSKSTEEGHVLLAIGATNGEIVFIRLSLENITLKDCFSQAAICVVRSADMCWSGAAKHILTVKSHQSGVNAIELCYTSKDKVIVYSGGDDNSLNICSIELCENTVLLTQSYNQQHSAQITGM